MLKLKNSAMLVVAVLCGYLALMTPDWKSDLVAASGVAYLNDQNGDGKADVLLQSTSDGSFSLALLNGLTVLNITSVGALADAGLPVISTGDFNGDGNADILTRDVGGSFIPGAFRVELTDTTGNVFDSAFMTTMSTDLNDQVMSTKDYNFDGTADVLLRNSVTGVWTMNYMHGTAAPTVGTLPGVTTNLCYTFKSDGDYDGNLVPDILLRKDAGGACGSPYPFLIYTMKGDFNYYQTGVPPIVQSPTYTMLDGDHDWNGDGRDDVLFRLASGTTKSWALYWMNGASAITGSTTLPGVALQSIWDLAALADFNGDGTTDLLLREIDTGQWYVYTENSAGGVIAGSVITGMNMNLAWQLQTVDDFNGDGRKDVLLRNTSTGAWQANLFGSTGLTVTSGSLTGVTTDLTYVIQND